jgi:hypothetical protein
LCLRNTKKCICPHKIHFIDGWNNGKILLLRRNQYNLLVDITHSSPLRSVHVGNRCLSLLTMMKHALLIAIVAALSASCSAFSIPVRAIARTHIKCHGHIRDGNDESSKPSSELSRRSAIFSTVALPLVYSSRQRSARFVLALEIKGK